MRNIDKSIILFDGVCNLCNTSVNFIIKHDTNNHFRFASLQSDAAKEQLLHNNIKNDKNQLDSIILIENNHIYYQSTAALLILKKLKFPINLGYVFIIIPVFIRDTVYHFIAKNRYKWFGKKDICRIPTKEELDKFL